MLTIAAAEQDHHDPNCATLTNGLGHAANDEGQEYRREAHECNTYLRYDHEDRGTSSGEA